MVALASTPRRHAALAALACLLLHGCQRSLGSSPCPCCWGSCCCRVRACCLRLARPCEHTPLSAAAPGRVQPAHPATCRPRGVQTQADALPGSAASSAPGLTCSSTHRPACQWLARGLALLAQCDQRAGHVKDAELGRAAATQVSAAARALLHQLPCPSTACAPGTGQGMCMRGMKPHLQAAEVHRVHSRIL